MVFSILSQNCHQALISSKGNLQNMNQMGKEDQGVWKMIISKYRTLTNGNDSCTVQAEATGLEFISPPHLKLALEIRLNCGNILNIVMSICPNTNY